MREALRRRTTVLNICVRTSVWELLCCQSSLRDSWASHTVLVLVCSSLRELCPFYSDSLLSKLDYSRLFSGAKTLSGAWEGDLASLMWVSHEFHDGSAVLEQREHVVLHRWLSPLRSALPGPFFLWPSLPGTCRLWWSEERSGLPHFPRRGTPRLGSELKQLFLHWNFWGVFINYSVSCRGVRWWCIHSFMTHLLTPIHGGAVLSSAVAITTKNCSCFHSLSFLKKSDT